MLGGSLLVYWLLKTTHIQEVMGSNPGAIYWMDNFHIYC